MQTVPVKWPVGETFFKPAWLWHETSVLQIIQIFKFNDYLELLKHLYFIPLLFIGVSCFSQTLGGRSVYNFLKLAPSPQLSALGGINNSLINNDVHLSYHNPALLNGQMAGTLGANVNLLYGGIKNMFLVYAQRSERWQANFSGAVNFLSYGKTDRTDASGNSTGSFNPNDFNVQLGFSKNYNERISYGGALKVISSNYAEFTSVGLAADIGIVYTDSASLFRAGLVVKNMGVQLKAYNGTAKDDLPFDLQLGISKRLEKAPVQFSVTLHHLHRFDIRYADTSFEAESSGAVKKGKFTLDKLARHAILSAQVYPSKQLELTLAYNFLRRKELSLYNTSNGLTGFSFGAGVLFKTLQVRFAQAYYQNSRAYNQFGLNIDLGEVYQ